MQERQAKEVMIPIEKYATVKESDTLKAALFVLRDSLAADSGGHRTLGVLNDRGDLTGFLTVRSILKSLEILPLKDNPAAGTGWRVPLVDSWARFFMRGRLEKIAEIKVKEVMRPVEKVFVQEDTPLPEVARTVLRNRVNHIPVLNEEKKVVGIIRSIDILDIIGSFLES